MHPSIPACTMRTLHRTVTSLAVGSLLLLAGMQLGALPNPTTPMTFRKLTPNLMVDDVNATVDFYRDVLGFLKGEWSFQILIS